MLHPCPKSTTRHVAQGSHFAWAIQMMDFVTREETLERMSAFITRMKHVLTAERFHRVNVLFEEYGVFDNQEYSASGATLGRQLKEQLTTVEGVAQDEWLIDVLDGQTEGLDVGILQRALTLAPEIADISALIDSYENTKDSLPVAVDILRGILRVNTLLQTNTPETASQVWEDITLIYDKLSSIPPSTLTVLHHGMQAVSRLLSPADLPSLRILLTDLSGPFTVPGQDHTGNASAVVLLDGLDMVDMVDMIPAMPPSPQVIQLVRTLDSAVGTDPIGTRESVQMLAKSGSFVLEVIEVFR
ncbi:hypothetical protein BDV18DRAFT_157571 [Aspergillus unguis]